MKVYLTTPKSGKAHIDFEVASCIFDKDGFHYWLYDDPDVEHYVSLEDLSYCHLKYTIIESGKH